MSFFNLPVRGCLQRRKAARAASSLVRAGLVVCVIALSACSTLRDYAPNFSWTYRIDIQQGTVVTKDMADKLQIGMTRDQVRFVLGTPLVADPFHADRWDYPYRFQPGRGDVQERKFTVFFENEKLARIDSDPLPTELEFRSGRKGELPPLPDAPDDRSWWQRLKGVFGS